MPSAILSLDPGHRGIVTQCSILAHEKLRCGTHRTAGPAARLADAKKPAAGGLGSAVYATGSLVWLFTSGATAQARSDEFAAKWMRDNA